MTSERMLQVANLVLRVSDLKGIVASITIGDERNMSIMVHDLRDDDAEKWNCTIFVADGRESEMTKDITYIKDMNFDAAEARIRQILEGVTEC